MIGVSSPEAKQKSTINIFLSCTLIKLESSQSSAAGHPTSRQAEVRVARQQHFGQREVETRGPSSLTPALMCPLTTPKAKRVSGFHNFPGFTFLTSSLENQLTLVDPRARSPSIPHLLKVEAFSPRQ